MWCILTIVEKLSKSGLRGSKIYMKDLDAVIEEGRLIRMNVRVWSEMSGSGVENRGWA